MSGIRPSERGLLAAAALFLVFSGWMGGEEEHAEESIRLSTLTQGPTGGAAWPQAVGELDLESDQLMRTWLELDRAAKDAALVLLAPTTPLADGEVEALVSWLRSGGRAIWVLAPNRLAPNVELSAYEPYDTALRERFGLRSSKARSSRLLREPTSAGAIRKELELSERVLHGLEFDDDAEPHEDWIVDPEGRPFATRLSIGRGLLSVFASPEPFTSARLGESDLPLELARELQRQAVAAAGPDGVPRVVFDERHHGHGTFSGPTGSLLYFLLHDPLGLAILMLGLLGFAWLLFGARRLGPPLAEPPRPRRSSVEHALALASGYARAKAGQRPRRALLLATGRALVSGQSAAPSAVLDALAAELQRLRIARPGHTPELESISRALETELSGAPLPQDDLPELCRALDALVELSHRT